VITDLLQTNEKVECSIRATLLVPSSLNKQRSVTKVLDGDDN